MKAVEQALAGPSRLLELVLALPGAPLRLVELASVLMLPTFSPLLLPAPLLTLEWMLAKLLKKVLVAEALVDPAMSTSRNRNVNIGCEERHSRAIESRRYVVQF